MPISEGPLYRGIRLDSNSEIKIFDEKYAVGNIIQSSFWSATPKLSDSYVGTRSLVINASTARDISELAFGVNYHSKVNKPVYSSESLIPPGVKFKVKGLNESGRLLLDEIK